MTLSETTVPTWLGRARKVRRRTRWSRSATSVARLGGDWRGVRAAIAPGGSPARQPPKLDHLGCPAVCWETEL